MPTIEEAKIAPKKGKFKPDPSKGRGEAKPKKGVFKGKAIKPKSVGDAATEAKNSCAS